jgi:acyl carrier protein
VSREDVDRTVREILQTVLGRRFARHEEIRRSRESAWDSLAHVNILFSIESELGIQFRADELDDLDSLEKLVAAAEAHLQPIAYPP